MNFGPLIRGTPAHAVNVFLLRQISCNSIKNRFSAKFQNFISGKWAYSYQIFSLTGLGRPRIMNAKIWPRPLRIWRKWGSNFLGVEQFQLPGGNIVGVT